MDKQVKISGEPQVMPYEKPKKQHINPTTQPPPHPYEHIDEKPVKLKEFNPIYTGSFFKRKFNEWKANRHPGRVIIVNMELINGMHRQSIALERDGGFTYRKKRYLFDNESKYFIIEAAMWAYDFHENFTLPLRREIPIQAIQDNYKENNPEIQYAYNPETIEQFIVAKIAEGIMRGADLQKFMRIVMILLIVILVILVLFVVMFMIKTGMFKSTPITTTTSTFAGMMH